MIIDSVHQNQNFPARILCVDDENHICQLLKAILFKAGYETFLAQSAKEGIAIARAEQVNLVLLDLKMPGISGYDACVALKSDPETSEIPIIMMSGLSDPEMRAKALDGGADEFITKPFDTTELLARVRSLVRIAKLRKSLLESNDELRSAYETARNAQEKYFSLVNDVLDSVFVVNTENGAIREANRAACSLLSIQKEDLIGRKFSDFCPEAPLIAADESLSIELRKTSLKHLSSRTPPKSSFNIRCATLLPGGRSKNKRSNRSGLPSLSKPLSQSMKK
jgi:DNA-binding response OmpR family regulator